MGQALISAPARRRTAARLRRAIPRRAGLRRAGLRRVVPRPALLACSTVAVAVALIPLVYLGVRTGEAGWVRITQEVFTRRTGVLASRSLALTVVVTGACTGLGVASAFLVTRCDLPARRLFGVLAALPLALPTYVAGFAWSSTFEGFEGFWPAALVLTLCSYPYVFLPVAAALRGVDAAQEEVSQSLGRGPWRTLTGVTLRQIRPAITAGAVLVALYVLSDFGAVSILRADTFTRAIFTAFTLGFDRTGALVLCPVLIALTGLLLLGEGMTRRRGARYARVGGAGRPPTLIRLGRLGGVSAAVLAGVSLLALGVPAASLTRWLAAGVSRPGSWTEIAAAAGSSLVVSLAGAALTVALALPVGLLVARAPGPLTDLVQRLVYLGHALPGVVIGLSLVFFGINVAFPLYQTVWLLAVGYAALFLPLAVGAVVAAAVQAPPVLEETARALGRPPLRVWFTITLPLILPGVGAAAALTLLTCMKELPATLLLRPTGMDTLATELWTHTAVAEYAAAAPHAALLVAFAALPTWLLAAHTGILDQGAAD